MECIEYVEEVRKKKFVAEDGREFDNPYDCFLHDNLDKTMILYGLRRLGSTFVNMHHIYTEKSEASYAFNNRISSLERREYEIVEIIVNLPMVEDIARNLTKEYKEQKNICEQIKENK